eukprot:5136585-Heterocapsa_arctica.AAC.1
MMHAAALDCAIVVAASPDDSVEGSSACMSSAMPVNAALIDPAARRRSHAAAVMPAPGPRWAPPGWPVVPLAPG